MLKKFFILLVSIILITAFSVNIYARSLAEAPLKDLQLKSEVYRNINHYSIQGSPVINVRNGMIELSGHFKDQKQLQYAVSIVQSVPKVKDVQLINITLDNSKAINPDAILASKVLGKIAQIKEYNFSNHKPTIQVSSLNSLIFINGKVDSLQTAQHIVSEAAKVKGVKFVRSNIHGFPENP